MEMKVCNKSSCPHKNRPQPISEFREDKRYNGGHRHQCKICERITSQEWSKTERGKKKTKARQSKYRKTEKGKATQKRMWKNRDRQKYLARTYLNKRIYRGQFPPARNFECKICGGQATEYHHYMGYKRENWMNVLPLCKSCHQGEHSNDNLSQTL